MVVAVVKLLMGKNYTPQIVLHLGARACACCGIRWVGQVMNGRHVKETAAWEGAGIAVCRACLGRFVRWLEEGAVPPDRAENFVLFTWAGWEIVQKEWKLRLAALCLRRVGERKNNGEVS